MDLHSTRYPAMNIIDFQDERANAYTQAYALRTMQELQSCLPKGEPPQAPSVWAPMVC